MFGYSAKARALHVVASRSWRPNPPSWRLWQITSGYLPPWYSCGSMMGVVSLNTKDILWEPVIDHSFFFLSALSSVIRLHCAATQRLAQLCGSRREGDLKTTASEHGVLEVRSNTSIFSHKPTAHLQRHSRRHKVAVVNTTCQSCSYLLHYSTGRRWVEVFENNGLWEWAQGVDTCKIASKYGRSVANPLGLSLQPNCD